MEFDRISITKFIGCGGAAGIHERMLFVLRNPVSGPGRSIAPSGRNPSPLTITWRSAAGRKNRGQAGAVIWIAQRDSQLVLDQRVRDALVVVPEAAGDRRQS